MTRSPKSCLIEACLELMATDAIVAIQDMGAAGLTSSSFEMASKGGLGVEAGPGPRADARRPACGRYEIMLSESQERMLMVLKPGEEGAAEAIFRKWESGFRRCRPACPTSGKRMVLTWDGDDRRRRADPPIGRRVARIRPALG